MIVARYIFPRGSSLIIPLDFSSDAGETTADFDVTASLRYSQFEPSDISADMPVVADFAVESRSDNAGWFLTTPSAELELGFYLAGIRMAAEGSVQISNRLALIEIVPPIVEAE